MPTDETYACYLAVPSRLHISPIVDLLNRYRVQFERKFEASSLFGNTPNDIKRSMRDVDFVFAVIDAKQDSANVFVALGVAFGVGRPVFIVVTPNSDLPLGLKGITAVKAEPSDVQAIEFHLDIFLKEGLKRRRRQHFVPRDKLKVQLSDQRTIADPYRQRLLSSRNESELEERIAKFLEQHGYQTIEQGEKIGRFRPDIAMWLKESSSTLGSQLLIEVKSGQRRAQVERKIANQLRQYLLDVDAQSGLVLWQEMRDDEEPRVQPGYPLIFSLSVPAFLRLVENGELEPTLVRQRNRHVHGIS